MNVPRIHPEITDVPEYDPFDDVPDLGPHENMTVRETLSVASRVPYGEIVTIGKCSCCDDILVNYSKMSPERLLYLAKQLERFALA